MSYIKENAVNVSLKGARFRNDSQRVFCKMQYKNPINTSALF